MVQLAMGPRKKGADTVLQDHHCFDCSSRTGNSFDLGRALGIHSPGAESILGLALPSLPAGLRDLCRCLSQVWNLVQDPAINPTTPHR